MRTLMLVPVMVLLATTGCLTWPADSKTNSELCPASMPTQGDFCAGDLGCNYGPQACQCGSCHPAFGCQCVNGSWACWHTDPLDCPEVYQDLPDATSDVSPEAVFDVNTDVNPNCPVDAPIGVASACGVPSSCEYGTECCCGQCYPSTVCTCDGAQWSCYATDACMIQSCPDVYEDVYEEVYQDVSYDVDQDARQDVDFDAWRDVNPACPIDPPFGQGGGCDVHGSCEYGTECCCGMCYASTICTCDGMQWTCYATDACMIPSCADVHTELPYEVSQDLPLWDVSYDGPPPEVYEVYATDVSLPACCAKNADCGPGWSCGTEGGDMGTCKPALPYGECWSQEDCATGFTCQGASVCPCNADCFVADQPGKCIPMPNGCCWVDSDCGAGKVCRAQGGGFGLPGSCVDDPNGPACTGDSACCWNDADCPKNTTCSGAAACGCIELCPVCGACMPDQMGTCG